MSGKDFGAQKKIITLKNQFPYPWLLEIDSLCLFSACLAGFFQTIRKWIFAPSWSLDWCCFLHEKCLQIYTLTCFLGFFFERTNTDRGRTYKLHTEGPLPNPAPPPTIWTKSLPYCEALELTAAPCHPWETARRVHDQGYWLCEKEAALHKWRKRQRGRRRNRSAIAGTMAAKRTTHAELRLAECLHRGLGSVSPGATTPSVV